jgi:tetratricopeptide (TPR) repeat protein
MTARRGAALAGALALAVSVVTGAGAAAAGALPGKAAQDVFAAGVAAYEAGQASEAEAAFRGLVASGHAHPDVLFNLGNAAYRLGRWPEAVYAYEWALGLEPRDEETRENLALARAQLVADEIPSDLSPLAREAMELLLSVPLLLSATLVALAWTAAWLLAALRVLTGRSGLAWPAAVLLLAGLLISAHVALVLREKAGIERGVLQRAEVQVKSGPGEDYATLFQLHAGTVVRVDGERAGWRRVRLPHGPSGWVDGPAVAVIGRIDTLAP